MDEWKLIGVVGGENYPVGRLTDEFPERKNYASRGGRIFFRGC